MKQLFTLLLLTSFSISYGQNQLTVSDFEAFCDSAGLKFNMPEGYKTIAVKENRDLSYSFAIINNNSTMEIRYSIWPLKASIKSYEESLKDSNSIMVHPNKHYNGRIQANVLNMTGGQMYDIGSFPPQAVKKEFNADDGGSCFFEFNCEFGKGYKYGQFVYLHKDDVADVIITFMSNNKETHSNLMKIGFHSLTFKFENDENILETSLFNELKLISSSDGVYIANKYNYKVAKFDTENFNTTEIIKQIRNSKLPDKELIARVLEMQPDNLRIKEIMYLANSNNDFAKVIIDYLNSELEIMKGKKELNLLKKKKD